MVDGGHGVHLKSFVLVEVFAIVAGEIAHRVRGVVDDAVVLGQHVGGIASALLHSTGGKTYHYGNKSK